MSLQLNYDVPRRHRPKVKLSGAAASLKEAADACRLLGGLFVFLGGFPLLPLLDNGVSRSFTAQLLAIVTTLLLIGPGVWYLVAARMIRRADYRAARISLIVVTAQATLIVIGLVGQCGGVGRWIGVPAILGMFFVPALGAAAWSLARARRTAEATANSAGFEVAAARPVLRPVPPGTPAAAPLPVIPQAAAAVSVLPLEGHADETPPPPLR